MEKFNVGPYVLELLPSEEEHLVSIWCPDWEPPDIAAVFLSREEAAHLAGILIHCVLERGAPASAVKSFREMTIGQLLESSALGEIPVEEEEPQEGRRSSEGPRRYPGGWAVVGSNRDCAVLLTLREGHGGALTPFQARELATLLRENADLAETDPLPDPGEEEEKKSGLRQFAEEMAKDARAGA